MTDPVEDTVLKVEMGFDSAAAVELQRLKNLAKTESTEKLIVDALRVYGWYLENKDSLYASRNETLVKVNLQL